MMMKTSLTRSNKRHNDKRHEQNRESIEILKRYLFLNDYILHFPTAKQIAFLAAPQLEVLYGGAAGGGKSEALLMAALQYIDQPHYAALLLRKTFTDLSLPNALMDRAQQWLGGTDARWNERDKRWTFPSGATLTFGYLENKHDRYRYQSSEFQFVGFDELTQFTESDYRYLFSRLRRLHNSPLPLRMRAATNPGGIGHEWVKQRFIQQRDPDRLFIPARIEDNPFLHHDYRDSLRRLSYVERQQLEHGDWEIMESGNYFKREWWKLLAEPPLAVRKVRAWDFASTEPSESNRDPDWSVGLLLYEVAGGYCVADVQRFRASPGGVAIRFAQTALIDGTDTQIVIEQEQGASGKMMIHYLQREVDLSRYTIHAHRPSRDKITRARPVSAECERNKIAVVVRDWTNEFITELERFPTGAHDDQVDALSLAYHALTTTDKVKISF